MSKKVSYYVCLDIGGTNIRGSWVNRDGEHGEIYLKKRPRDLGGTKEVLIEIIDRIIKGCPEKPSLIGIASAGPLDIHNKTYLSTANMKELDFFPIGAFLEHTFSLPTILENDAQAAAMGEITYGCLKGRKNGITITLGTGVGTGVILNGEIWRAAHITGPELGHIFLGGKHTCGCGQVGCAETLLNKKELLNIAERYGFEVSGIKELMKLEKTESFSKLLKEYGKRLGLFIVQLQVIFGIKNICISGGLVYFASLCKEFISNTIEERLNKRKWWMPQRIEFSDNPNMSAILGMAAIANRNLG